MGILPDFYGQGQGGGGLFDNMWAPILEALKNGTFDPQGANNMPPPMAANVPMPQPRPDMEGQGAPPGAMPVSGPIPPGMPPQMPPQRQQPPIQPPWMPQQGEPGFGDRLQAAGAGFFNAGSPMEAVGNLIGGAITGKRQDPHGMAQESRDRSQAATYKALMDAEVPQPIAMAAALNPEVLKTIAPNLYTKPELKIVKDVLGGEHGFVWDARTQTLKPASAGVGDSNSSLGAGPQLLAPGVKSIDSSLTGDAYVSQFSPEVQAAVKAYINGDVMPTGNPRLQGISNTAKTIAQKWGQDTGNPVSDATYQTKRKYRMELGGTSPGSAGGQVKAFEQGTEHAVKLGESLLKLDNSKGLGIPVVADSVNYLRQAFSTNQSAVADKVSSIGQTLAGEVGKLFSGSQGGGVHERQLTRQRFSSVKSPEQLAAALEATMEMMHGGVTALEAQKDRNLGPNNGVELISAETKKNIAKIEEMIAALKGQMPKPTQQAPASSGWSVKRL